MRGRSIASCAERWRATPSKAWPISCEILTGLYSREGLLTLGARCQEEAQRTGGELVLICALFENLHTLREGFGPGAANHAVLDVAQLLAESCQRSDLVARLGQAQFAILAVDAVAPSAPVICGVYARILSACRF
jgi:GGDEF domain-containing protein